MIILAHSMGGVIAAYCAEVLGHWRELRAVYCFGSPFRGSLFALDVLCNGAPFPLGRLSETIKTFPSIYQLLPIYRCVYVDGTWSGIKDCTERLDLDAEKVIDGLRLRDELATARAANESREDYRASGFQLVPVAGVLQRTRQHAVLRDGGVELSDAPFLDLPRGLADGDGVVPRLSALPTFYRSGDGVVFGAACHSSIYSSPDVLRQLVHQIQLLQAGQLSAIRRPAGAPLPSVGGLRVTMKDVVRTGSELTVHCTPMLGRLESIRMSYSVFLAGRTLETGEMDPAGDDYIASFRAASPGVAEVRCEASLGGSTLASAEDLVLIHE